MTKRNFAKITEVGICNENGIASVVESCGGRRTIARPDFPITDLVSDLIAKLIDWVGWSSEEAAKNDIDTCIEKLKACRDYAPEGEEGDG